MPSWRFWGPQARMAAEGQRPAVQQAVGAARAAQGSLVEQAFSLQDRISFSMINQTPSFDSYGSRACSAFTVRASFIHEPGPPVHR